MKLSHVMHVCGARDFEGVNEGGWSCREAIRHIIISVESYERPYKGDHRVAGYGFYNFCAMGNRRKGAGDPMSRLKRINYFANYVKRNNLGTVTIAPDCTNPHYGEDHVLRAAIFVPNNKRMIAFGIAKKWIKAPEVINTTTAHPTWTSAWELGRAIERANARA